MADDNPGQFGKREDTEEQAHRGGEAQGQENNPGNFANRSEAERRRAGENGGSETHTGGNQQAA